MVPSMGRSHLAVCFLKARRRTFLLHLITFAILAGSKSQVLPTLKGRALRLHWYDSREWRPPTVLEEFCLPQSGHGFVPQGACTVLIAGETRLTLLNHWDRTLNVTMASRKKFPSHPHPILLSVQLSSVQSVSLVWLFVTLWNAACQASLSITNSWSLLKLMSIVLVMPSNHLILCHPLLLLPSMFPSIRVFSCESALRMPWWLRQQSVCLQCVQSLDWEDLLEKEMATHSSILAWKIPWTEEPGSYSLWGRKSRTRLSDFSFFFFRSLWGYKEFDKI